MPADALEIARKNNDEATRKALLMSLPADGGEAVNAQFGSKQQSLIIPDKCLRKIFSILLPGQNLYKPGNAAILNRQSSSQ